MAVIELEEYELMEDWLNLCLTDSEKKIVTEELTHNRYAMKITCVKKIQPIPLQLIKSKFPDFFVPISYIYLDKRPDLLSLILKETKYLDEGFRNCFQDVSIEQMCL